MDDTWFQILVIVMSVLLIIILTIVALIGYRIYKLMKTVRMITDQAQNIMGKADHVASFFEKTAWPVAIAKLVANMGSHFGNEHKKRKKGSHGTQSE